MIRTGELIGHSPGFNFKYLDNTPENPWHFKDPQTIDESTGGAFDIDELYNKDGIVTIDENGICVMCHSQRIDYYRLYL